MDEIEKIYEEFENDESLKKIVAMVKMLVALDEALKDIMLSLDTIEEKVKSQGGGKEVDGEGT